MDVCICIGDLVTFSACDTGGYLTAAPDSGTNSAISCSYNQVQRSQLEDCADPLGVIDKNALVFEVCATNKYKAEKKLHKLRHDADVDQSELKQAKKEANQESKENEKSNRSQQGRKVYYGQVIQLKSVSTQKYMDCRRQKQLNGENKQGKPVNLSDRNGQTVQFRFVQKDSSDEASTVVKPGDSVTIESTKDSGQYVQVVPDSSQAVSNGFSVELSSTSTDFKITRVCRPSNSPNGIHTGDVIQISHKRLESVLIAENFASTSGIVYFQKSGNLGTKNDKANDPYGSFWQIDIVKAGDGMLHADNLCRLLHISTQKFLFHENESFGLTTDKTDRRTFFKLQPTKQKTKYLQNGCSVQLKNIGSKCWLCSSKDTQWKSRVNVEKDSVFLGTSIPQDKVQCHMTLSSKQSSVADTFQLTRVEQQNRKEIYIVQELKARTTMFLQKDQNELAGNVQQMTNNIGAITDYMLSSDDSSTHQQLQSFVCESGLMKCLFKLMGYHTTGTRINEQLYTSAAGLIDICFRGASVKTKQFGVQYLDFCMQETINKQAPLKHKSLAILVEIFEDNKPLINTLKDHHIDKIFELFTLEKSHLYFKLLGALCLCQGCPIVRNQVYVANKLVAGDENKELCYLSYMGEQIGMKENTIYISTSLAQPWVELQDVYKNDSLYLQYHHQLEFFRILCQGGNVQAVRRLTTELGFITFDHLKWSLMDQNVSPKHRATYCQLLTVMFIEANREPVCGRMPLAYDLESLQENEPLESDDQITPIIDLVFETILQNGVLIASADEQNIFLSAVLDMAYSLILYGHMGNQGNKTLSEQVEQCFEGIAKILDGKTDVPNKGHNSAEEKKNFVDKERFKNKHSTSGMKMAKISALKVLDLFIQRQKADLMLDYIQIFNDQTSHVHTDTNKYMAYLRTLPKVPARLIHEDMLLDLTKYEDQDVVQKALDTLNKLFSVKEHMLDMAKLVQVLRSPLSRTTYKKIETAASKLTDAIKSGDPLQYKESSQLCGELAQLCVDHSGDPIPFNQMMVFNTGLLDVVFQLLQMNISHGDDIFVLTKSLTRGNSVVQAFMIGQLDILLNIPNISTELTETLMEIFQENAEVCLKVDQRHMTRIFELLDHLKQPELIMLLHVIVRPTPDRTIKRNKRMVASCLAAYRSVLFEDGSRDRVKHQHGTKTGSHLSEFRLALLDFLATCAEDDIIFQQTYCAAVSCNEVLEVLTSSEHVSLKIPYLRYLTCMFVQTEKQQLMQNDSVWSLVRSFNYTLQTVRETTVNIPGFIQKNSSKMCLERNTLQNEEAMVLYLIEGILPFLKALFIGRGVTITQQYQPDVDTLDSDLQKFVTDISQHVTDCPSVQTLLKDVLHAVHSHSMAKGDVEVIINNLETASSPNLQSFVAVEANKESDADLNTRFQTFTRNMCCVYLYGTLEKPASNMEDDGFKLPDNEGLKSLVQCFVLENGKTDQEKYQPLSVLCKYLSYSSSQDPNPTNGELDLRCFQILRSVLHQEIKHIPSQTGQHTSKNQSRLAKVESIQNVLVNFGCVDCIFCHLQGRDPQCQGQLKGQVLALLADLLFNRNQLAQTTILKVTSGTPSEHFYQTLHMILQQGIEEFKERKLQWAPQKNHNNNHTKRRNNGKTHSNGPTNGRIHSGKVSPTVNETEVQEHLFTGDKASSSLTMAIRILGNLGGSIQELKNLMRVQPSSSKSYNLVGDCTSLMTILCHQLDSSSVNLFMDVVRTLTYLVSGNAENQSTVIDNNGLDSVNHVMLTWEFSNISTREILEVKQLNVMLARTLIEMNYGSHLDTKHADLPKLVAEQIDTQTLIKEITLTWNSSQNKKSDASINEVTIQTQSSADRDLMKDLCRQYYLLLSRKMDLVPAEQEEVLSDDIEVQELLASLDRKKKTLELCKDGVMQKHYATKDLMVKPDKKTRQSVREETDRSSFQSKLYDLVKWSAEYSRNSSPRRTLASNVVGRTFIRAWVPLNVILIVLTLILVIYISVAFTAPNSDSVKFDHPDYLFRHGEVVVYVVGGVHNFISVAIFVYFILLESPTIPGLSHIASIPRAKTTKVTPLKSTANWSDKFYQHQLAMSAFSLKSIYYTLFLACSIAGTALDGYFFAYHLFHIIIVSSHLQKLAKVIQHAWKYLLMLALVMVAIVFVYSIMIFLFFRDYWDDTYNERHTNNIFQCFISLLHHGLVERTHHADTSFKDEVRYAAFDLGFFVMVTIICLYLALGIIIDSFTAIRKKQDKARHEDATICFICNRMVSDFHQSTKGFDHHVQMEHNIWDYMAFLYYLDHANPQALTGLEQFVLQKLQKKELDFFPRWSPAPSNRSMTSESYLDLKVHQIELRIAEMNARLFKESNLHKTQDSDDESTADIPRLRMDRGRDRVRVMDK